MKLITETGSNYEVDLESYRLRRLSGNASPTKNQGEDGEWQSFISISPIRPTQPVLIVWRVDHDEEGLGVILRRTQTSPVVSVFDVIAR